MKQILLITTCCFLCFGATAQYNLENLKMEESPMIKDLFTYKNLKLYPITCNDKFLKAHEGLGEYTTLSEALETDQLWITENGGNQGADQSQVNKLMVRNISQDTVYLMAGEVVKGGKQDRVLAQDIIIPPNEEEVDLSVFCVEKGRWSYGDNEEGKFDGYSGMAGMSLQKVVDKESNQTAVWEEVENVTASHDASTSTGTYTALKDSKEFVSELNEYQKHYAKAMEASNQVVGAVIVTGDKIVGCEMFATPDLFMRQFPNLISSYATDAISAESTPSVDEAEVLAYLEEILEDESKQEEVVSEKGKMFYNGSKKLRIKTY